ncbi:hypothetical protein C8J57DRAFT_1293724 [Mycena rebaudengoi]|nr:hypothetical protein C8J57DRAFT_1293724 [Mycena rebaudengoi]
MLRATRLFTSRSLLPVGPPRRRYAKMPRSPHADWYSQILPAMLPISLLAGAVYTVLLYTQLNLSHEKSMEIQSAQLAQLEAEVDALQQARQKN